VSQPVADHGHVDTGGDELNANTVTPRVRRHAFCRERRHVPRGGLNVLLELEANARGAQRLTVSVDEDGFIICARLSPQKRFEHVDCFWP